MPTNVILQYTYGTSTEMESVRDSAKLIDATAFESPKQHDVDQGGQLPEEAFSRESEHDQGRVDVGGADGHGHQRHHAGLFALELTGKAGEKRPPTVQVDHRSKDEHDVIVARESKPLSQAELCWIIGLRARIGTVSASEIQKHRWNMVTEWPAWRPLAVTWPSWADGLATTGKSAGG